MHARINNGKPIRLGALDGMDLGPWWEFITPTAISKDAHADPKYEWCRA
jgi:hypothetical protein